MFKINQGYKSLFEYLSSRDFLFFKKLEEKLYPEEYQRYYRTETPIPGRHWNPEPYRAQQILGGLQPLADMHQGCRRHI